MIQAVSHAITQHKGDVAAAVGAGAGSFAAWVELANPILDFVGAGLGIIATLLAIAWYVTRFINKDEDK